MASSDTPALESADGPVLSVISKRLRALKKKHNRILQMEESVAQGKPINKEQEDVLRSKPQVVSAIDELEKLRHPLSIAVQQELELSFQQRRLPSPSPSTASASETNNNSEADSGNRAGVDDVIEDLLNLLYFGSLFDVKSQGDFTATMLTRTHERGCCLTYDYVTDDATDLLREQDLDMISMLGGLLISRPVNSSLSHKNALQRCMEHAKHWLANSDSPIEPNANVSYAELRERLKKIMALDYFTTTPAMRGPVEVVAAAAAGNYVPFQVPVHGGPTSMPTQAEGSDVQCQMKDEDRKNLEGHENGDDDSSPALELSKDEFETENAEEVVSDHEQVKPLAEGEHDQRSVEYKERHYVSRRSYQNQRGGRGGGNGGRRGYSNGRGGRGGGGSRGGGRNQYHDQLGNFYPRNYYNNRGRGSRGGGQYNHHGSAPGGHVPADSGVAS